MDARWIVAGVGIALWVAPVASFGELGVWQFDHEVSHLVWDEGQTRPGSAAQAPPVDPPPASPNRAPPVPLAAAALVAVAALAGGAALLARRPRAPERPSH